nr:unnamed protein product [Digitaria exilis]
MRFRKPVKDSANTNIFEHAGRVFAITENHLPYEINIDNLETLGPYDINGDWEQPFTSHPKKVCSSGELVIMGINPEKPHYLVGVISSGGQRLLHKVDLKFEKAKFIHDIGVTTKYNIIIDFPLRFGISRTLLQKPGITTEAYITTEDVAMDFPVINENFTGLFKYKMIAKLHFDEPDKKNGRDEDDGWVITYVHDEGTNISQVYIIDAKRFSDEPIAKITLPQRVPYGFHGNFFYK